MKDNMKEIVKNIRLELDKLKNSKDKKIKEIYNNLSVYVEKLSEPIKREVTEETGTIVEEQDTKTAKVEADTASEDDEDIEDEDEDDEESDVEDDEVVEDKDPKNKKPVKKETKIESVKETPTKVVEKITETVEEKVDDSKSIDVKGEELKAEIALSKQVSLKLKEAALELQKYQSDIKVKEEIIDTYKKQLSEVQVELNKYKEVERIELQKKIDNKINTLVELYANLGIKKQKQEITNNFSEDQVDKLIIDLSVLTPNPSMIEKTKPKRLTEVSLELNNSQNKKKEISSTESAKILFGIE